MGKTILVTGILFSSLLQNSLAGDVAKGKAVYREYDCTTCHARDGMGEAKVVNGVPAIGTNEGPRVAGLSEEYSIAQITAIQGLDPKTERKTDFTKSMKKQIKNLTKTDIEDLAAYLAKGINPAAGEHKGLSAK